MHLLNRPSYRLRCRKAKKKIDRKRQNAQLYLVANYKVISFVENYASFLCFTFFALFPFFYGTII